MRKSLMIWVSAVVMLTLCSCSKDENVETVVSDPEALYAIIIPEDAYLTDLTNNRVLTLDNIIAANPETGEFKLKDTKAIDVVASPKNAIQFFSNGELLFEATLYSPVYSMLPLGLTFSYFLTDKNGFSRYDLGITRIVNQDGTTEGNPTEEQVRGIMRMYEILEKAGKTSSNIEYDFSFSKECLYEPQCISPVDALVTATTPEGWTITTYGGTLTEAEFNSQPPASPEQFFSKMLKMTESNMLKFSSSLKNSQVNYANYYQFYQGTFIPNTGYLCHFDNNDKLTKIEGVFAPIEGLNMTPSISSDEADAVISRFLNREIKGSMLQITPFYKDGNIDVRLTYMIDDYMGGCFAHYRCFVDAHSGEVLLSEFP